LPSCSHRHAPRPGAAIRCPAHSRRRTRAVLRLYHPILKVRRPRLAQQPQCLPHLTAASTTSVIDDKRIFFIAGALMNQRPPNQAGVLAHRPAISRAATSASCAPDFANAHRTILASCSGRRRRATSAATAARFDGQPDAAIPRAPDVVMLFVAAATSTPHEEQPICGRRHFLPRPAIRQGASKIPSSACRPKCSPRPMSTLWCSRIRGGRRHRRGSGRVASPIRIGQKGPCRSCSSTRHVGGARPSFGVRDRRQPAAAPYPLSNTSLRRYPRVSTSGLPDLRAALPADRRP